MTGKQNERIRLAIGRFSLALSDLADTIAGALMEETPHQPVWADDSDPLETEDADLFGEVEGRGNATAVLESPNPVAESQGVVPSGPNGEGKQVMAAEKSALPPDPALDRAKDMLRFPKDLLPFPAGIYAKRLATRLGASQEAYFMAYAFYAQVVEKLPCRVK